MEEKKDIKGSWGILLRHMKEYSPSIALLSVFGAVSAISNGIVPYVMGLFLDALIDLSKTITVFGFIFSAWFVLLALWVVVQLSANVTDWLIDRRGGVLRMQMHLGYQAKAFSHLLFAPLSFHKDEKVGALTEQISKTGWQISSIADSILISITPQILSVMVGIAVTAMINPLFTLILITGVVIYVVVLIRLIIPTGNLLEDGHVAWDEAFADATQALTNVQSVKHMATEKYEEKKIKDHFIETTTGLWVKLQHMWSSVNFYQRMIVLVTQAIIFFLSVYYIQRGELSVGELVALNGYAALLIGPFVQLGHNWQVLQNGLVSIKQAEEKIFNTPTERYHPLNAYAPEKIEGNVSFLGVNFWYDEGHHVLHNLNFEVKKGEKVAFVGKSGVGKSTAIDLISAYYFPSKGKVLVDGRDTREFDLTALRKDIAIVPQEPALFNDTIMMNIRYGRLEATDAEVFEAAKKAHADEFIRSLPHGYGQLVGERGVKLSVGQKQRIAIARAILRDPSILILDEPTSALDAETEQNIAESFEILMEGRTTFIIAHRLSTVRKADRIFVFDKGEIVEEGKHDELLKIPNGIYRGLHDYQSGKGDEI